MRRWLLVLLCAACSSDHGGPVTYDQFEADVQTDFCSYLVRCGVFPDAATCEASNEGVEVVSDASTTAAIDMGRIAFNGAQASACLAAVGAASCDSTMSRATPAACTNIISGTVGSGSACALDAECLSQVCDVPSCTMACCQGTCVGGAVPTGLATGVPCSTNDQCVGGDFSRLADGRMRAIPCGGLCVQRLVRVRGRLRVRRRAGSLQDAARHRLGVPG